MLFLDSVMVKQVEGKLGMIIWQRKMLGLTFMITFEMSISFMITFRFIKFRTSRLKP